MSTSPEEKETSQEGNTGDGSRGNRLRGRLFQEESRRRKIRRYQGKIRRKEEKRIQPKAENNSKSRRGPRRADIEGEAILAFRMETNEKKRSTGNQREKYTKEEARELMNLLLSICRAVFPSASREQTSLSSIYKLLPPLRRYSSLSAGSLEIALVAELIPRRPERLDLLQLLKEVNEEKYHDCLHTESSSFLPQDFFVLHPAHRQST